MENIFLKYMSDRMNQENMPPKEQGPVITISRQYGCYASKIAQILIEKLNHHAKAQGKTYEWHVLSKEILDEASRKLDVNAGKISHIFGASEKNFLGDLVESFSTKKYASDSHIKRTIKLIVKSYAEQGYVVIVGRAGCVIARHIPLALHIRLMAPYEWRVERIMERFHLDLHAAQKQLNDNDEKRKMFMNFYKGDKPDCDLFDAVFNRSTMTDEEIVESILKIVFLRKLV